MGRLVFKTYDDIKDRSPLYCAGGAILFGAMTAREFSSVDAVGLRFWLMLVTVMAFTGAAIVLLQRQRIIIEVMDDSNEEGQLKIIRRGRPDQVIGESQFGYVKMGEGLVIIHHYEGEDLKRTSFSTKGARKKKVDAIVEVLGNWKS
jgi:hypothetical protein